MPGVLYTAGVKHANNVAAGAASDAGINARAVSGETPKRELAEILAGFERGEVDVLCNAMLLAEGWNSPRATICMHLAPTASRRIYQQRVGRVTRRNPGKEAGLVIDFVHPATTHDETIVTLHSLLDRDVYRGGAIVVGPVRRGRGRRVRVERRVVPVSDDPTSAACRCSSASCGGSPSRTSTTPSSTPGRRSPAPGSTRQGWRRAKAMLQHDQTKELRRRFLLTCVQRNRNSQLRTQGAEPRSPTLRDAEAFDDAIDIVGTWTRDDRRAGTKMLLQALAERRIGRRDQAQAWVWRLAGYTRDLHEEYAVQRWPETKRLLGLLVNSSGRAHGRNARRLVHAARNQDRRLAAALLAARRRPHPRGRGGPARRAHADGPQALGGRPRAAAQLPQGAASGASAGTSAKGEGSAGQASRRVEGRSQGPARRRARKDDGSRARARERPATRPRPLRDGAGPRRRRG